MTGEIPIGFMTIGKMREGFFERKVGPLDEIELVGTAGGKEEMAVILEHCGKGTLRASAVMRCMNKNGKWKEVAEMEGKKTNGGKSWIDAQMSKSFNSYTR